MTTVNDVLNEARRWLGTAEQPAGSNNVPGVTDRFGIRAAWCDMWVSTVLENAGIDLPGVGFTWVSSHFDWAKKQPGWTVFTDWRQARPGDLVGWEWGSTAGGLDHISLVEANGPFTTIGGNERDAVRRQVFSGAPSGAVIFARPPYAVEAAPPPPAPAPAPGPAPAPPSIAAVSTHREVTMIPFVNTDGREEVVGLSPDGSLVSSWEGSPGSGLGNFTVVLPADAPKFSGIFPTKTKPADGRLAVRLSGPAGVPWGAWQNGPGGGWVCFKLADLQALSKKG